MSGDAVVDGPYVYQPFGSVTHLEHNKAGRLWAVSGLHHLARIEGLTKAEAEGIVQLLRTPTPSAPAIRALLSDAFESLDILAQIARSGAMSDEAGANVEAELAVISKACRAAASQKGEGA